MEKRISRESVYEGKTIKIHKDTVIIRKRKTVRELIKHPGSSVIIPILKKNPCTILMIRQYRYAAGKYLLELPAGTRNKKESFLECAKREIREETGYKAKIFKKLTGFYPSPGIMNEYMEVYTAYELQKSPLKKDFDENIKVIPVTLSKAVEMILSGKIRDAKTIAGILVFNADYTR